LQRYELLPTVGTNPLALFNALGIFVTSKFIVVRKDLLTNLTRLRCGINANFRPSQTQGQRVFGHFRLARLFAPPSFQNVGDGFAFVRKKHFAMNEYLFASETRDKWSVDDVHSVIVFMVLIVYIQLLEF
jgi:hypothetical protein